MIGAGPWGKQTVYDMEIENVPMPNVYLVRQMIYHFRVIGWLLRHWSELDVIFVSADFGDLANSFEVITYCETRKTAVICYGYARSEFG